MKILVTGNYEPEYNRTAILLEGLRKKGIELIEYRYKKFDKTILQEKSQNADLVFIPSFLYKNVKEVKKAVNIPVLFDPLISIYMTKVFDKKTVWKYSPRALKNYWKDYSAFHSADALFADTMAHKNYFVETFKIAPEKIFILPVGVDTKEFYPKKVMKNNVFKVGFYGSFLPLQGIDKIVKAANLLKEENIDWEIIGDGFELNKIQKLVKKLNLDKVNLTGRFHYSKLNDAINTFDICLGIFGSSIKTDLVVPNKVFHYAACGKCFITKNTKGIREIFTHNETAILVDGSAESIASAILALKEDDGNRNLIGGNAKELMITQYDTLNIAEAFLKATVNL